MDANLFRPSWARVRSVAGVLLVVGLGFLTVSPCGAERRKGAEAEAAVLEAELEAEIQDADAAKAAVPVEPAKADVQPAAPAEPQYSLRLVGGDHLLGRLVDSAAGDDLSWQAAGFAGPFSVARQQTQEIQFSDAATPATPPGKYCFLLAHRARLVGSLLSIDDQTVTIDVVGAGRLEVDRGALHRMYRCDSPALVYIGPQGLDGWLSTGPKKAWHGEAGRLATERTHSSLLRNFSDLPRACYEIDVSWKGTPNFSLAFGVDLKPGVIVDVLSDDTRYPKPPVGAFLCETWGKHLVIKRETEKDADFADLDANLAADGELRLQIYVDQAEGRMIVLSETGKLLGELTVPGGKVPSGNAIWLTNLVGELKLNSLRVSHWNGDPPKPTGTANQHQLKRIDGNLLRATILSFDGERRQFALDYGDDRHESIDEDQLQDIVLAPPGEDDNAGLWCVNDRQGLQFAGKIVKVEHDSLWLDCPGIREPVALALSTIRTINPMQQPEPAFGKPGSRQGRLEMAGTSMHGSLTPPSEGSPTCLAWQPVWSKTAAAFLPGASGQVIYREPQVANPQVPGQGFAVARAPVVQPPPQQPGLLNRIFGVQRVPKNGQNETIEKAAKYPSVLHLRSGDNIRCKVTKIDDRGVTMLTATADATFVPNEQVMALELVVESQAKVISKTKQERLLMTPRMQRASPPTHLIRSASGDYLRGRLVAMDDLQLEMEIRLESKTIPRTAVARVIWLHPEATEAPAPAVESPAGQIWLQTLDPDGKRLTMFGESFAESTISGHNEVLGKCRIDVSGIDRLYLGSAVELAAAELPFHQWKPRVAPNPIDTSDDEEEDIAANSPLVGKPAPEFAIDLVGGKRFNWDDYRGKIVVLDFWASWCGPCMQTLPMVDKVAQQFAGQGVCLVAVNLQETSEQVKQTLAKLHLETVVGLDVDGAVAKKYGATAIPQTVVVGRDGNVSRVFVGGSAHFDEQLRAAVEAALTGKPETAE
ncbi:MAG TPA: TlpA disulfide reductase family protein [Pirellulales bacterium]|jgi:thiol-disulfide isomerase/thioredoxin|nr:TlpA disulfide reductase family protein [Pirellulales bacterium]